MKDVSGLFVYSVKKHIFFKTCPLLISLYNSLFLRETMATFGVHDTHFMDVCLITP